MHTQVTVNPDNSRVLVASNANDTFWVLNVGDGECAVLELQVSSTCSKGTPMLPTIFAWQIRWRTLLLSHDRFRVPLSDSKGKSKCTCSSTCRWR